MGDSVAKGTEVNSRMPGSVSGVSLADITDKDESNRVTVRANRDKAASTFCSHHLFVLLHTLGTTAAKIWLLHSKVTLLMLSNV